MRQFDPRLEPTFVPTRPEPPRASAVGPHAATGAAGAASAASALRLDARLVIALEHASDAMSPPDEGLMARVTARLNALIATGDSTAQASEAPIAWPPLPNVAVAPVATNASSVPQATGHTAEAAPAAANAEPAPAAAVAGAGAGAAEPMAPPPAPAAPQAKLLVSSQVKPPAAAVAPAAGLRSRASAAVRHALAKITRTRRPQRSKPPAGRARPAVRRQALSRPLVQFGAAAGFTTLVVCTGYAVVNPSSEDLRRWGAQLSAVAQAARSVIELGTPALARSSMTVAGAPDVGAYAVSLPAPAASAVAAAPVSATGPADSATGAALVEAPLDAPPVAACQFRPVDLREISRDGPTQILSGGVQGLGLLAARRAATETAKPGRVAVLELRPASALSCRVTIDGWSTPRVHLAESAGGQRVLVAAQANPAGEETLRFFDAQTCAPIDQVGVGKTGWRLSEGKVFAVPGAGLEAARVRELGSDCRPMKSDVAAVADTVVLPSGPASSVLPIPTSPQGASSAGAVPLAELPNPKFTSSKLTPVKVSEAASAAAALAALPAASFPAIAASAPGMLPVNWSTSLELPGPADLTWRMALPFVTPIAMENEDLKGRATNCNSLLALRSKGYVGVNDEALGAVSREGARCMALSMLARVRPAARSMFAEFKLDLNAPKVLPASLMAEVDEATEDIVAEAERLGRSLQTAHMPMFPKIEGRQLVLVGKTWESRLEILARGDFNGDGFEDLLVVSEGHPVDGTLTTAKLVMVSKTLPDGPIKTVKRII